MLPEFIIWFVATLYAIFLSTDIFVWGATIASYGRFPFQEATKLLNLRRIYFMKWVLILTVATVLLILLRINAKIIILLFCLWIPHLFLYYSRPPTALILGASDKRLFILRRQIAQTLFPIRTITFLNTGSTIPKFVHGMERFKFKVNNIRIPDEDWRSTVFYWIAHTPYLIFDVRSQTPYVREEVAYLRNIGLMDKAKFVADKYAIGIVDTYDVIPVSEFDALNSLYADYMEKWSRSSFRFLLAIARPSKPSSNESILYNDFRRQLMNLDKSSNFNTPRLHRLIKEGRFRDVKQLLDESGDPNIEDQYGRTALHICAQTTESLNLAKLLIEYHANINASGLLRKGITPLHVAALFENIEMIQILLKQGININIADSHGITALHIAASEGNHEVTDLLLRSGANPNVKDEDSSTPLFFSAQINSYKIAKLLVENGVFVDERLLKGTTPLMTSINRSNLLVASFLVASGANVDARDEFGRTSLFRATNADSVNLLIDNEASLTPTDQWGNSPLHIMAENGFSSAMEALLIKNVKVDVVNIKGRTPLHWASEPEIVELLARYGATMEKPDKKGITPYQLALQEGRLRVAQAIQRY